MVSGSVTNPGEALNRGHFPPGSTAFQRIRKTGRT